MRAVGTGGEYGTPLQITHYYPYGLPFAEGIGASVNRYKYTGKELITEDNLNFYDFEARLQWPDLPIFNRPDPKEEEYTWLSPYTFCAANPIRNTDPTGMIVVADSLSQQNIINTLSEEEAQFVQFDDNGVLDTATLDNCTTFSNNILSLLSLAKSPLNYLFVVSDCDSNGRYYYEKGDEGYRGTTEVPGGECNPSPDSNVYVRVGACLSREQQALTTAHEAYGHALLYEWTRDYNQMAHHYKPVKEGDSVKLEEYFDEDLQMNWWRPVYQDKNEILQNLIKTATDETEHNIRNR